VQQVARPTSLATASVTVDAAVPNGRPSKSVPAKVLRAVVWVFIMCLLALAPMYLGAFPLSLAGDILVLGIIALSTDLLVGVTGLPSLGQAAYYGVGGYAAGLVAMHMTSNVFVQLVVSLAVGALAAAVTGWIAVRTRGVYFLMLTLAIGQIFYSLSVSSKAVTGGSDGLAGIPAPSLGTGESGQLGLGAQTYWYVLFVAALALAAGLLVVRTRFGHALRGIRQNESRMRALGFPTSHYKYVIFIIAGGIAGIAGSVQVVNRGYFSPDALTYQVSSLALFAALIGGRGSLVGGFGGAAIIIVVRDVIGANTSGHGPLLLGILFALVVYLLPGGLLGVSGRVARRVRWLSGRRKADAVS
jgi:branched-chain amino acid transport system permease protein